MENIRLGIIGVGNIGFAHAASVESGKVNGMMLAALCDTDENKREKLKDLYPNCSIFDDYKKMIDSGTVDACLVSVPHPMHAEIACYALKRGVHTLVEKPVDISVSAARRLNETAQKSKSVFAIMFNQRTNILFQKAKEIIEDGKLGKLKRSVWIITNWFRTQNYYDSGDWRATWAGEGGGVLLNQCPHQLDLWQWLCGMPKAITAFCEEGKYHNVEVEDDAVIFAEYDNGATGTFITSTGEYPGTNRLEITGELGKLVLENRTLKWWKLTESSADVCENVKGMSAEIETEYMEFPDGEEKTGHIEIIQNFADAILYNKPLIAPGVEGVKELAISNAAYLSSWCGNKKVFLPFDEEEFLKRLMDKIQNSRYKEKTTEKTYSDGKYSSRWRVRW